MKFIRVILSLIFILAALFAVYFFIPQGKGQYTITVTEGQSRYEIAQSIAQKTRVLNSEVLLASAALAGNTAIIPGEYSITLPAQYTGVWKQMYARANAIREEQKKPTRSVVKVTIPEGISIDKMLTIFEKSGYTKTSELRQYWTEFNRPLTQKYAFLPPNMFCNYGDITACAKYYLEGYLFPDTYNFYIDEDVESVTQKFLDNFTVKNPELLQLTSEQIYKKLILASVVEDEVGRGSRKNDVLVQEERDGVAGVFVNRIANDMKWQTDPSVTYGTGKVLCQIGSDIENCSYLNESIFEDSLYNTYVIVGAPIGPLNSPSSASIKAALYPAEHNYLFFVSDESGKAYFAATYAEHQANLARLEGINQSLKQKE